MVVICARFPALCINVRNVFNLRTTYDVNVIVNVNNRFIYYIAQSHKASLLHCVC